MVHFKSLVCVFCNMLQYVIENAFYIYICMSAHTYKYKPVYIVKEFFTFQLKLKKPVFSI